MADKKKKIKRNPDGDEVPTKEDYAVAKHLRFTLEAKKAKLAGMEVNYFIASKAVDALLESKWMTSKANADTDALFHSRNSCITYCHRLLEKGIFHIANKRERKKERLEKVKKKKKKDDIEGKEDEGGDVAEAADSTPKARERKKGKKEKEAQKEAEAKKEEKAKDEDKDKEKKKKKLIKLEMADVQAFTGGDQYCVWIYDPVPLKTFVIGLFLVIGAIGLCLFPLWPPEVRIGIYYLSLVGLACVGVIIALIILRFVVFCLVWCATFGKHHLWLLPNLTEDVGFVDSFKPAYVHTVRLKVDIGEKVEEPTALTSQEDEGVGDGVKRAAAKGEAIETDEASAATNGDQDFEVVQHSEVTEDETGDDVDGGGASEDVIDEDDDDEEEVADENDDELDDEENDDDVEEEEEDKAAVDEKDAEAKKTE